MVREYKFRGFNVGLNVGIDAIMAVVRGLWVPVLLMFTLWPGFASAAGAHRPYDPVEVPPDTLSHVRPFEVSDYFKIRRVTELSSSPTGDAVAYVVESTAPDLGSFERELFVQHLPGGTRQAGEPRAVPVPEGAHGFQWMPDGKHLAFMTVIGGTSQVMSLQAEVGTAAQEATQDTQAVQVTHCADPVTSFSFHGVGERLQLAYSTQKSAPVQPFFVDRMRQENSGVVINPDFFSFMEALDSTGKNTIYRHSGAVQFEDEKIWLMDANGVVRDASIPGTVQTYHWSSDGKRISVVYRPSAIPQSILQHLFTSIGVLDVKSLSFLPVFEARPGSGKINEKGSDPGVGYRGGEWAPGDRKILVLRLNNPDPWQKSEYPQWAICDVAKSSGSGRCNPGEGHGESEWHDVGLSYGRFHVVDDRSVLLEDDIRATRSVYVVDDSGARVSSIVSSLPGSSDRLSLSADQTKAVFVNESMTQPQEIYLWEKQGNRVNKISSINRFIKSVQMPLVSRVSWASKDGTQVDGWLLMPASAPAFSGKSGPLPVVTFLHGGPGYPVSDEFAEYFDLWPYPMAVLPSRGIAVFIPNYRGTMGYGMAFSTPSALDRESVDDVGTGVQWLVDHGIADKDRLGI